MKAHDWLKLANDEWNQLRSKPDNHLRMGQFYMNHLYKHAPEVYERIHGTECDPFYVNERVPEFLIALWIRWED